MFKSGDTRLDETTTYIRNLAPIDQGLRTRAADFVEQFLSSNPTRKATVSSSLHIGDSSADPQGNRHARRAYVLLYKAIEATCVTALGTGLPAANVSVAPGLARQHLPSLVQWAAILRDQTTMSSYCMQQLLQQLIHTPLQFLQNNPIIVLGSPTRDATQGDRNVLPFYLAFSTASPFRRLQFSITATSGAAAAAVDSVTARWWTDIPGSYVKGGNAAHGNFSQLRGIELCSQLMVTTQFTGCAFAMKRANGHMYCAHTTPRPPMSGFTDAVRPMTGNQLAQDVHALNGVAGDFANVPGGNPLAIYGAAWSFGILNNASYPNGLGGGASYMTIIGVQRAGDYEIYSQVTQNQLVTSAQRIF